MIVMRSKQDLLIEIGTEELPPKSLSGVAQALHDEMCDAFKEHALDFATTSWYATPRRIAVIIRQLSTCQPDRQAQRRGPALSAAFDDAGKPTRAAEGFARSCGATVGQLEKLETDKGRWLIFDARVKGKPTKTLIPDLLETALKRLPIARRMRWGASNVEFIRPIKWVVLLFGRETIASEIMGIKAGRQSFGHRFHHPEAIPIEQPDDYPALLKKPGMVLANYNERSALIRSQVERIAEKNNGTAVIDPELLDEVTALVEWPVSFMGHFNPDFLKLPKEVLIASMQDHQKYFPVLDKAGNLQASFIGVANIESLQPALIKQGNERVIQPRLSDATFFWNRDLNNGLATHIAGLKKIVYQKKLGSLYEKSERLHNIIASLAIPLKVDINNAQRAAELCFCDLLTDMVFEFPKLQGTMGKYYAAADGEDATVAAALEAYYLPRFAGDALPSTKLAQCLAMSEKVDTLLGIFAIGKVPTGDKDPFGLRRTAIGLLRIIIECECDIDLKALLDIAADNYPDAINAKDRVDDVFQFLMVRLRQYYLDAGVSFDVFESVLAIRTGKLLDFHQRLTAVTAFRKRPEAQSLAAANKRIGNILKKSTGLDNDKIDDDLLTAGSETTLAISLQAYQKKVMPMIANRDYQATLTELAGLRGDIDNFFDNVMVLCDDNDIKRNRLALLNNLRLLFLKIADISKLQG